LALAATFAVMPAASARTAQALEAGVHADPGSPAAKEYALPLAQARQTGAGGSASTSASSPPFGAGIKPSSDGSGRASRSRAGARRPGRGAGGTRRARGRADESAEAGPIALAAEQAKEGRSNGSALALLAGGAGVLAAAAVGGTILRGGRGRKHHPAQ